MKKITYFSLFFMCIVFSACKNESNKNEILDENQPVLEAEQDPLDVISEAQEKALENAYFYVLAPNGLSLRKSDNLSSEKILTIPFGEKVKQIAPIYTVDITVENIAGSMMEITYKDKTGYAFNGFLSSFPLLEKEEKIEDYASRLKAVNSKVSFEEKETDPDFHEGIVQTIILPNSSWHEAFYLAKAIFNIPKSLTFPSQRGIKKETINQKDKEAYVWSSDLFISRNTKTLDTLQYNWRAEGSGYFVTITEPKEKQIKIEYTGFAD